MPLVSSELQTDALGLARGCFESGDYDQALALADSLLANGCEVFPALLLRASVESERKQYRESLRTLDQAGTLIDEAPARLKARFYGQRAHVNKKLGNLDSPLVDYEAARYWAQEAGDELCEASVRNNLAKRYSELGRTEEALRESDAAIHIATVWDDRFLLGRFLDLRAQVFLEHGRVDEAIESSKKAIEILRPIGNQVALDEALSTCGMALARAALACLTQSDPLERFCSRRAAANLFKAGLDEEVIQLALKRCGGNVQRASVLLNIKHPSLLEAIKRHGLGPLQKRHLRKSIIKK